MKWWRRIRHTHEASWDDWKLVIIRRASQRWWYFLTWTKPTL